MNHLAGNTNSPIPIPPYYPGSIISGKGPYVIDSNSEKYIDLWMGYGALLFGHADSDLLTAIRESTEKGWFFSYQTHLEKELAELIHNIIPSAEKVRFATTGSDAVAYAIRASRAYTGRDKVLSIIGGYHGVHEGMTPSDGILDNKLLDLVPFNDVAAVEKFLKTKEYACFILEPILANCGCTPPEDGYLKKVRDICDHTGTVLIFDEIVTGFRIGLSGAQGYYSVTPDMSLFSKAIAGGLPLSAVCGKKDIMEKFIPTGDVFFAGTFNGSPLSLYIAKVVINKLKSGNLYKENEELGNLFRQYIKEQISEFKLPACVQGIFSMSTLAFGCQSFKRGIKLEQFDTKAYNFFIEEMAKRHVLLPPLPTETIFLSPVHQSVLGDIKVAIRESLEVMKENYYIENI